MIEWVMKNSCDGLLFSPWFNPLIHVKSMSGLWSCGVHWHLIRTAGRFCRLFCVWEIIPRENPVSSITCWVETCKFRAWHPRTIVSPSSPPDLPIAIKTVLPFRAIQISDLRAYNNSVQHYCTTRSSKFVPILTATSSWVCAGNAFFYPNKNEPCFALLFWHATFYIHNLIIRTTT